MKRTILMACLASFLLGGCLVATHPGGRPVYVEESCPADRYWDGHKCKKDHWEKHEEHEERKEERREDKEERKEQKREDKEERKRDKDHDHGDDHDD